MFCSVDKTEDLSPGHSISVISYNCSEQVKEEPSYIRGFATKTMQLELEKITVN